MTGDVLIITPTYKRDISILERCILCVKSQSYPKVRHLVVYDDLEVPDDVYDLCESHGVEVISIGAENSNTWGAYPRQFGMEYDLFGADYVAFVDDDNVIFPTYVSKMVEKIESEPLDAVICEIIHMGPLSKAFFSNIPAVVTGKPPMLKNIDTLNVLFRWGTFAKFGWVVDKGDEGYFNDGYTYERIFQSGIKYGYVSEVLGVHL